MLDSYSLSPKQAWACRIVGAVLLGCAAVMILLAIAIWWWPAFSDPFCDLTECGDMEMLLDMLPSELRAQVAASPHLATRLSDYADRWPIGHALVAMNLLEFLPLILLLGFVGIAQRRLGTRTGDGLEQALPWLRRAARTALVMAVIAPVFASLRVTLLQPAINGEHGLYVMVDLGEIVLNLMLAFAALSVSWALSAGSRARSDIAEII